MHYDFPLL